LLPGPRDTLSEDHREQMNAKNLRAGLQSILKHRTLKSK